MRKATEEKLKQEILEDLRKAVVARRPATEAEIQAYLDSPGRKARVERARAVIAKYGLPKGW